MPPLLLAIALPIGCNSILNGWLTPIELGSFSREVTLEIRDSLSIQDTPRRTRGETEPTPDDLIATLEEYRLLPGDVANVFIFELRGRGVESGQQGTVDNQGLINLPVIGWVQVGGMTAREVEEQIRSVLAERDILYDAEVLVQFAAQRGLTYTIFGNESLAVRLNRGPGVFPIPRPDFRLLDGLSISGGLSELISEIYIFRQVARDKAQRAAIEATSDTPQEAETTPTIETPEIPTQEPVVPPPPLPSASLFSGLPASPAQAFSGNPGRPVWALQPPPDDEQEPAADETPPDDDAGIKESADEDSDVKPSAQEEIDDIIDLMLTEPAAEQTPADWDAMQQESQTPDDTSQQPAASQDEGVAPPTKWIFLNGEWIEVAPDQAPQIVLPQIPTDEEGVEPAVDWDTVADQDQQVRVIRISAEGLRQGDPRYNVVIRAGDVIRIYSGDIGFYYMTGHVRRPGVYSFRSGATITLKNAVAAAAGLDAFGWPDRVSVYRRVGDREQLIQVNLDRIYAGLEPDFYLKRDDIVNFGTHPVAPFLVQLRNLTVPQMGGSITYFVRWLRQESVFSQRNLDAPSTPRLFP